MTKRKIRLAILLAAVLLALLLCVFAVCLIRQSRSVKERVTIGRGPNNVYSRTLVITGDMDYDPYTFYDAKGVPSGHDVELVYLLAERMGYNVEIRLLPWNDALAEAAEGKADMVMTVAWAKENPEGLGLSVPIVNDPFVAFGKKPYNRIGELYSKRLAIQKGMGCVDWFIKPYRLELNTAAYSSNTDAFSAVERGERDYVIARYSVGRRAIANGAEGIEAVGPSLLDNYLCLGVSLKNAPLLATLNKTITELAADGTLAGLSDKWLGEYVRTLTVGEYIQQNLNALLLAGGALLLLFLIAYLMITRKVSANKEEVLRRLAERDQLTGLYNRVTCEGMIRETLIGSNPATDMHALLVIDMDNFKQVNDVFGHMEGDEALRRLATGLAHMFRACDIVGRLGGDEFFVFMPACTDMEIVLRKAKEICLFSGDSYTKSGATLDLSASVGVAVYPAQGTDFSTLYKAADEALYDAKRRGKKGCSYYASDGQKSHCGF